jgi:hypothetical protein
MPAHSSIVTSAMAIAGRRTPDLPGLRDRFKQVVRRIVHGGIVQLHFPGSIVA